MGNIVNVAGVSRANGYYVPTERLSIQQDSRRWASGTKDIAELAESIVLNGQLLPLLVAWGKSSEGKEELVVVAGRRRLAAICYINSHPELVERLNKAHQEAVVKLDDLPLPVLCLQYKGPESFTAAAIENVHRNGLGPVDRAHCIATLEQEGKTRREIAGILRISESLISCDLKLLTLPISTQREINEGRLAASVGYEMAGENQKAEPETSAAGATSSREEPKASAETAKPTRESIRQKKRERAERGEQVSGPISRSRKVIYNDFAEFAGCGDGTVEEPIKKAFSVMLRYMDGKVGIRAVLNQLRDLSGEG